MNKYPNSLIQVLNDEQKKVFITVLNKKTLIDLDLEKELNKILSSFGGWFSETKSYRQILEEVCLKRNLKIDNNSSIHKLEESILQNKFKTIIENLGDEDKKKFQKELEKFATKNGVDASQIKSLTALGTLAGANFAGFGLYIMATTVVGGITSAIGLTLPFAVYTGMSSVLSIVTGPVGWIAGLGYLAYSFRNESLESAQKKLTDTAKGVRNVFTGNVEYCEVIISQICSFRILLHQEFAEKKEKYNLELKSLREKSTVSAKVQSEIQEKIFNLNKQLNEVNIEVREVNRKTDLTTKNLSEIEQKLKSLR